MTNTNQCEQTQLFYFGMMMTNHANEFEYQDDRNMNHQNAMEGSWGSNIVHNSFREAIESSILEYDLDFINVDEILNIIGYYLVV